jgi:acetyltransferase-like isoleucine patch superfamily enzyme
MLMLKIIYHIQAIVKIFFYNLIYGKRLNIGKGVTFRKGFSLLIGKEGEIQIDNGCFFNHYCSITAVNNILIGEGTIFGEGVKIYDHNHCYLDKDISIKNQGYNSAPIIIGKHCWIASNVVILKGITIGDNCVIGAGCVIYKNISDNSIVINQQDHVTKTI